ncbi:translation initiation factor IF-3 [Elusimicrobiota bacterium]
MGRNYYVKEKLPYWRANREIRTSTVRLIDSMGVQLGIQPTQEALRIAEREGLDLIEVAPKANPPVCKLGKFDKYKYEQLRKWKEQHKKQRSGDLKEVRFSPKLHDHDLEVKLKRIEKFLDQHDKVRITVFFRGRERAHPELGMKLMIKVKERTEKKAKIDREPLQEGNRLIMILAPKR